MYENFIIPNMYMIPINLNIKEKHNTTRQDNGAKVLNIVFKLCCFNIENADT